MKLKKLLNVLPLTLYRGNKEIEITGVTTHSKYVHPGNLFISKKSASDEAHKHIEEAINSGASAIVLDTPNPFLKNIVQLISNEADIEGKIAATYYQNPSQELTTIGVTGTSGKTTVSTLIKYMLDQLGISCGLIGSIEYVIGEQRRAATLTTPDVITNHKMLKEMLHANCKAACLEVSSHGLAQGRVNEIDFHTAIYTNLSQDHLDYHHTMEEYAKTKAQLFTHLKKTSHAIINSDCPWHQSMIQDCRANIVTYGFSENANIRAKLTSFTPSGTTFEVTYRGRTLMFSWNLIGKHNVSNALAAIATLLGLDIDFEQMPALIASFSAPKGRLERVDSSFVFVDYAHKPDALEKVLTALCEIKKSRIITVFGCGGNRDQTKRPLMASIAEKYSDFTVVTSDNPRNEDPDQIIQAIVAGFAQSNYCVEPDRKKAIEKAIGMKKDDDIVLIAGKGHETYQIFGSKTVHFDDLSVAKEFL